MSVYGHTDWHRLLLVYTLMGKACQDNHQTKVTRLPRGGEGSLGLGEILSGLSSSDKVILLIWHVPLWDMIHRDASRKHAPLDFWSSRGARLQLLSRIPEPTATGRHLSLWRTFRYSALRGHWRCPLTLYMIWWWKDLAKLLLSTEHGASSPFLGCPFSLFFFF